MKVRYTKYYKDEFETEFQPGWVGEHSEPEGRRRIALGVCEEADANARAFKYEEDAPLSIEQCVAEPQEPQENTPISIGKVISSPIKTNNKH